MTPPDRRLDDLLVRYWDDTLTAGEAAELNRALADDPAARDRFRTFCLYAVAIGESRSGPRPVPRPRRPVGRWAAVAAVTAGGLAAAVLLAVGGGVAPPVPGPPPGWTYLVRATGIVRVRTADIDRPVETGAAVDPGATVAIRGAESSAVLRYPDGTEVVLTGDTEATVGPAGGPRLTLARGAVTAAVPAGQPFTVATPEARAVANGGATVSVSRSTAQTEVGVTAGHVRVTAPDGDPLMDMSQGELGTVDPGGAARKQPVTHAPDEYRWDPHQPLPADWGLGRLTTSPGGRAFAPVQWNDPCYDMFRCWGLRSENRWLRGLYRIHPDTRYRVRYKVDRPGTAQLLAVVRTDPPDKNPNTCNVLLAPIPFEPAADGGWRTVELSATDWEVEQNPGRLPLDRPMPLVVFLVAFNTYDQDLGLRVAEFTVARGTLPPPLE